MNKQKTFATRQLYSLFLDRVVQVDLYYAFGKQDTVENNTSLLLINDGQHMKELGLPDILEIAENDGLKNSLLCAAIHCGPDRLNEYGVAGVPDFKKRGAKASLYSQFITNELIPFVQKETGTQIFKDKSFAGFSLGGLSALDISWHHSQDFLNVGVFSGSLWWRARDLNDGYKEETDRIIHNQVRNGGYYPWLRFFFETGTLDETADRNNNGIIDSIDDTLDLIKALEQKGYQSGRDICYLELSDGRHDVATWAKAMPLFLKWGWGIE